MDLQENDREKKHGDVLQSKGRAPYGGNNENLRTIVEKCICIYVYIYLKIIA